jgi:hypothetical protein
MKIKLLLLVWLLACGWGFGQVTIYYENMYNGVGGASGNSIALHEANNRFNENDLTYSGTGDMRTTFASSGYIGASGTWNVMLNSTGETLIIDGLSLSSYSNILVSFGIRKATNASNGSSLIVEYSTTGTSGTFTALVWPLLPTGTGTATWYLRQISSFLPNNATTLRFRTTDGTEFRIDDILIEGILSLVPSISLSPSSLTNLDYLLGNGPSAEQTFTVSGTNLTNDITLTAPTNFEISTTSGSGFGNTINLLQTGGSVANTTIYTRMVGGLTTGNYNGNITATSTGATNQNVAVSGTVVADVVITEIMYDTPGANDLEWIEICNLTGTTQNIANYQIAVNGTTRFTFPAGANVPANSCITVRIGYVAASPSPECPFTPTFSNPIGTTDILVNTSRTITLVAANGVSVSDEVTYSNADGADGNGSTIHVIDATVDNSSTGNGNWTEVSNGGSPGVNTIISPCAVQNIVVRGDIGLFPTIANGDTTPQGTDNTLYAAQTIGNSQDKTFRVANEGSLPLTISAIALSGDTADFTITQLPAFNLAVGTFDILEITFAPTVAGERNATVTITSDDPDTPVYTFAIRGTGNCAVSSPTLSPNSGPVGTIVTLNGENFGPSTTLTYQGIPLTVTVISVTELEFEIPAGAGSGVAAFTNDIGCEGTVSFTVLDNTITSCQGTAGSAPTDLFISEVTDATFGGLTYVEIFNGTGATVDLGDYAIQLYSNGSTSPQYTLNLNTVNLSNQDTYVIAIGMGSANCSVPGGNGSFANQTTTQAGINVIPDEHDMIRLVKNGESIIVDEFGVYDDENWMNTTIVTGDRGFNFRRLNTAASLPRVPFNLSDWEVIDWPGSGSTTCQTNNDYSNIGNYDFSLGNPPSVSSPILTSSNCLEATITVTATEGFVGNNPITYQWFSSAPGDTNWTALANNAIYNGVTTNTLTINNTFNLNNYQYYCEVRENTTTCAQASDAVRINIEQTAWDGSSWSNGLPDGNTVAIINNDYVTNFGGEQVSFQACSLIINSGRLTVENGDFIEVYNNVIVETNGEIIVQTQGAFIQRGIGVNAGTFNVNGSGLAQVNKLTSPLASVFSYTYWSSPVADTDVDVALFFANPARRFYFNANNFNSTLVPDIDDEGDDWTNATGTGLMIPGRGYAATQSSIGFVAGNQYQYEFVGAFNTGDISYPLAYNPINTDHWNLVGNPYPSAIDVDQLFLANSSIKEAVYLWSHFRDPLATNPGNEVLNFNQNDYLVINETAELGNGSDLNNDGVVDGLDIPDRTIPSGQSFFVSSTSANPIVFNNAMRISGNNSNNDFYRSVEASNTTELDNKLWINLNSDNGVYSQTVIGYVENATHGNDGMRYDARRNEAVENAAIIYTLINNDYSTKYAIQGRSKSDLNINEIIPLGFKSNLNQPTTYTIKAIKFQGEFLESNTIYLKDNLLNITHNLTESGYLFTSETGTFNNRFEIVFNRETLSDNDELIRANQLSVIELPNGDVQFNVAQQQQIKQIEIIDLLGHTVYRLSGNNHTETYNLSQLSKAAYIAKVTLANGQTLHKKAVKRF